MIVKLNEQRKLEASGVKIKGIILSLFILAAANNTALTKSDIDLEKVFCKLELKRGKQNFVLAEDNLRVLACESGFHDSTFTHASINMGGLGNTGDILIVKDTSVKEQQVYTVTINFPTIDLSSNDQLIFNCRTNTGLLSANLDTNSSFIEFEYIYSTDVELGTPYIETQAISPGESKKRFSLGDNVHSITFINLDKTSIISADQVLNNVSINAQGFSSNENYFELLCKRNDTFETRENSKGRSQSFELYNGEEIDNVTLDLQFVSTNVINGKCFVVVRRTYKDARLITLAQHSQDKKAHKMLSKVGVQSSVNSSVIESNIAKLQK